MLRKYLTIMYISAISMVLSACAGENSTQVQAMQRKDKQLSCKEVLLEMNEAQFYKKMAQKNKDPKLKTVLMPLGYISTYMGAEEAMETASARIDYLDKIYDIMDCEKNNAGFQQQPVSSYQNSAPPTYMGTNYSGSANNYRPMSFTAPATQYQGNAMAQQNSGGQNTSKKFW